MIYKTSIKNRAIKLDILKLFLRLSMKVNLKMYIEVSGRKLSGIYLNNIGWKLFIDVSKFVLTTQKDKIQLNYG